MLIRKTLLREGKDPECGNQDASLGIGGYRRVPEAIGG